MKLVPDMYRVRDLVSLIDDGHMAIPEFQRKFVWRPPAVSDLLVSVARRWPIGSLLLLEGPQDFAVRPLDGAPELTSAELLVLDGQQRITALYLALGDRSTDEVYVIDFAALREDGELGDEHIRARRRRPFEKQHATPEARAAQGLLTVEEAVDTARFAEWQRHLPDELQAGAFEVRDAHLGGLQEYSVPAVRLPRDIDLEALAKIFETLNRTGERLRPFDLMVARLYPHDFRLVDRWSEARYSHAEFDRFAIDGLEILRLIALRDAVESRREGRAGGSKGIRGGDVLHLDPARVKEHWDWAVESYVDAVQLVRDECGVRHPDLLPSETMLLPLALVLAQSGDQARRAATNFYWAATLTQAYSQGANTQALKDGRELLEHVVDSGRSPETVRRFSPDEALLQDVRRRNESLLRGLLCLLVRDGARDWSDRKRLSQHDSFEVHQVFPPDWLSARGVSADALMNFTLLANPLSADDRRSLPDEVPALHQDPKLLAEHGLPSDNESLREWTAFSRHRLRFWLDRLEQLAVTLRVDVRADETPARHGD